MKLLDRLSLFPDSVDYGFRPEPQNCRYSEVRYFSGASWIHAWHVTCLSDVPRATVLHFHGNAGNVTNHWPQLRWAVRAQCDVFTFDYRGFGNSTGVATLAGCEADVLATLDWIPQHIRTQNTILFGQSLGGYLLLHALRRQSVTGVRGLILDSTFGNIAALIRNKLSRWLPFTAVTRSIADRIAGNAVLPDGNQSIPYPVCCIHSSNDPVIPYESGLALYNSLEGNKALITTFEKEHLSFFVDNQSNWPQFENWLWKNCGIAPNKAVNPSGGSSGF